MFGFSKASLTKLFSDALFKKALSAILILLLPIVVSFIVMYWSVTKQIKDLVLKDLAILAESYEVQVFEFFEMSRRRAQDFASDGFIRDQMNMIVMGDMSAVQPLNSHLLQNKMPLDETIHAIHITSLEGLVAASTDNSLIGKEIGSYIFSKKTTGGSTFIGRINVLEDTPSLYIQSPITDRATRKTIGNIINIISLSEINRVLTGEFAKELGAVSSTKKKHKTMVAYLVNNDRLMITGTSLKDEAIFKQKTDTLPVNLCLESGKEMTGFYKNYRGVEVAGASMCFPGMEWALLVEVDKDDVLAPVATMRIYASLLAALVASLAAILFAAFLRGVVLPLRRNALALSDAQRIAHLGNWEWDIVKNRLNWSEEIYRIFGMPREIRRKNSAAEFPGTWEAFLNKVHPDDRDLIKKSVEEALYERSPYNLEHRIVMPDGSVRAVREQAEVEFSSDQPVMMHGTVQDITEQKQSEQEAILLKTIAQAISECADIHTALSIVTQMVCEYEAWVFGEVWVPSTDNTHLTCDTAWYSSGDDLRSFRRESLGFKFARGVGLPGRVWATKKPAWVNDVTKDPNFPRAAFAREVNIKAGIALPVIANEAIIAVIAFYLDEAREEDSRAVELASSIATQLGLVIKRKYFESSRATLATILETTTDFVATFAVGRHVLHYNTAARKMLEIPEHEELVKSSISECFPLWAQGVVIDKGLQDAIGKGAWNGEAALISRSGREIPVSLLILSHKHTNGTIAFFSVTARDITERKRSEMELKNLSAAIANSVNIIFMTDLAGRIKYANTAMERITGWPRKALIGSTPAICKAGDTPQDIYRDLWTTILSGKTWRGELKNHTRYGQTYWVNAVISPILNEKGGIANFLAVQEDVTEKKRSEERIQFLAAYDDLTGLSNRTSFMCQMNDWIESGRADNRAEDRTGVLLLINLDEFKSINDAHGHGAGDELLCQTAEALRHILKEMDMQTETAFLGRLGGDEFALFISGLELQKGMALADMIRTRAGEITLAGLNFHPTISLGLVSYPEHGTAPKELFIKADAALSRAKELGRNRCHVYKSEDRYLENLQLRLAEKERIKDALAADRFLPWFQPILNLKDNTIHHYEALARMLDEDNNIILPSGFIDTAERVGLIGDIGRSIAGRTMKLQADMAQQGRRLTFSINLSGKDMGNRELLSEFKTMLAESGADPGCIVFEITETEAIQDMRLAITFIDALKAIGCCFSLDDFGVGFTSFVYLREMQVDYIKIDGSFIRNLHENQKDQLFVRAITDVAKGLNIMTIAEFVETEETLGILRAYGVDYAQGYLIGKPGPELPGL